MRGNVSTIGRNSPCPCGSGKKYKKCCLPAAPAAPAPGAPAVSVVPPSNVPDFARRPLDEQTAFALLLEGSEAFRRYYAAVSRQLPDFQVVHDTALPVGIRARITWVEDRAYLRVSAPVCPLDEARLIAHELGHLQQDAQGFPSVGSAVDHPAASAVNSAVHDPLIDAVLEEHGFDGSADRLAEIEESRRQLSQNTAGPTDVASRAQWTANCLASLLDQHVLGEDPAVSDFLEWFEQRYPAIWKWARRLADGVIARGFDTPETMMESLCYVRRALKEGGGVISPPVYPSSTGL